MASPPRLPVAWPTYLEELARMPKTDTRCEKGCTWPSATLFFFLAAFKPSLCLSALSETSWRLPTLPSGSLMTQLERMLGVSDGGGKAMPANLLASAIVSLTSTDELCSHEAAASCQGRPWEELARESETSASSSVSCFVPGLVPGLLAVTIELSILSCRTLSSTDTNRTGFLESERPCCDEACCMSAWSRLLLGTSL